MGKTPLNPFGTKSASPINPLGKTSRSLLNPFGSKASSSTDGAGETSDALEVAQPAPPVTASAQEVVQAGIDLRRQQLLKKGFKSTIKAGDSGGYRPGGGGKMAAGVGGNPFVPPQGKF